MDSDSTTSTILSADTTAVESNESIQISEQAVYARTTSAQAEVLGNQDLLGVIFASTQPFSVTMEETTLSKSWATRDILRIALTCKNFYEPAINVLWRSMISWAPLLRLIPSVIHDGGVYTTNSSIIVQDLERFNFYSKRILHFNLMPERARGRNSLQVSPHLGALLAHHRRLENISFPALQTLTINFLSIYPSSIPVLFLLPQASLTTARLKWANAVDRQVASSFINVLSEVSPAISGLHLEGYSPDSTLYTRRVRGFKQLREVSLELGPEPMAPLPDLWSQLTHLQHLTVLSLNFPSSEYLGQFYVPCVFDSLDNVNISGPMDSVVVILRLIKVSHLLELNVTLDKASSVGLNRLKTLLPVSLEDLSIHSVCVDAIIDFSPDVQSINIVSDCAANLIPNSLFAKFSSISHLHKFSICLDIINLSFIESLRLAKWKWPILQELHLYPSVSFPSSLHSALSLLAIAALVRLFPDLNSLSVPIFFNTNAKKIQIMETRIADKRHYHLRELYLTSVSVPSLNPLHLKSTKFCPDYSNYRALLVITEFIDHLFPRLEVISAESWYIDSTWLSAVEKGVMAFQKARQREREMNRTCCNNSNGLNDSITSSTSARKR